MSCFQLIYPNLHCAFAFQWFCFNIIFFIVIYLFHKKREMRREKIIYLFHKKREMRREIAIYLYHIKREK